VVERTVDVGYICSIAKHPRVWPWISEDPDSPDHYMPETDRTVYLKVEGGYLSFKPFTRACWEVHICMLPKAKDVREKVLACLEWMARRGVSRFMVKIPVINRHAIRLAKSVGFSECGTVEKCVLRRGKMIDMVLMRYQYA
jgi:putative hemolysin